MTGWETALGTAVGLSLLFVGLRVVAGELTAAVHPAIDSSLSKRASVASAFFPGLVFAGVAQSSSAVAATSVGLAHAGALSFERAFAVILGANVGTTLTAQLSAVSFSFSRVTLPMILCGLAVRAASGAAARLGWNRFGRNRADRGRRRPVGVTVAASARLPAAAAYGGALAGLGAMLMGLNMIGSSLTPLVRLPAVLHLLSETAGHPILGVLIGAAVTAIAQSSSAVSATVVQLSAVGNIPLETAVALVLGSNIGTVATTLLAALGLGTAAKKTAVADLLFNVTGVCLAILFFPWFVRLLWLLSADAGQRVAHAHTLFNAATAAVMLPFLPAFTRLVGRIVGDGGRS